MATTTTDETTNDKDSGIVMGQDGIARCFWAGHDAEYQRYHDEEWGLPVDKDQRLFEKLCLEGFQAGLSWLTILRKRDNFRRAFASFDFYKVAKFDDGDIERLVGDAGIVRHRGKIESAINNARRACEIVASEGSLAAYLWRWQPSAAERPRIRNRQALMALSKTDTSTALSKDLKRRGWTFVGPTTCYAFMQAMGLVNDHIDGCAAQSRSDRARKRFRPPK